MEETKTVESLCETCSKKDWCKFKCDNVDYCSDYKDEKK